MSLRGDERGQALQVGAVLLFGILIIFLSMYQITVVPDQNAEVEFNSYLEASADMNRLHADVLASGGRGVQAETTVQTGTTYPARAIFLNPPPPTGSVRTSDAANVTLSAVATDGELAEYWDGTSHNFSSKRVVFRPSYNEISVSPVVVTGSLTYRNTSGSAVTLGAQTLIRNDRITLVTVMGNLSESGLSAPIVVEPVSAATQTITVTDSGRDPDGDGEDELVLTIPSEVSASVWQQALANQPRVEDVVPNGTDRVDIILEGNVVYELRLAKVEVRGQSDSSVVPDTAPHYVTSVSGDGATVHRDQAVDLTVEVRDRLNNPKSGVSVTFELPDGTTVTRTTGEDGRATVRYVPKDTGTKQITARFGGGDTPLEQTTFTVDVTGDTKDGSGTVILQDVKPWNTKAGLVDSTYEGVNITVQNIADHSHELIGISLEYVTKWNASATILDGPDEITSVSLDNIKLSMKSSAIEGEDLSYFSRPASIGPGERVHLKLELDESYELSGDRALTISVVLYFEGGYAAEYSVYLFG